MKNVVSLFPPQGAGSAGRQARTLVDVYRGRAAGQPDRMAFTFLLDGEEETRAATYGELDRQARAIAAHLQQVAAPGDRALLMYDAGLEYVAALAGCLYAGVVAVPVFPPDPVRTARTLPRLEAIVTDACAKVLLGAASDLAWAGSLLGQLPALKTLVSSDKVELAMADQWREPAIDRDTLAFLQYTSGSTGAPKGVMVRHGNLLSNMDQMERTIDIDDAVACTWLPAYHDMGLIGGIFQCWYSGRHNVLMAPLAFFQHPLRWLRAIERYRATTIAAPDFAYDLCVRKTTPAERATLDLSSLRLILSGAETVRIETINRFVEAFAPCGVRREMFMPCYGMAETTLRVTNGLRGAGPTLRHFDAAQLAQNRAAPVASGQEHALALVGCGFGVAEQEIVIVDPQTLEPLFPGQIGEIWVSGPHVAAGYWGRPEQSEQTFQARTSCGQGPFLRTGDLGFLDQGELFISGRLKDLIIVRGKNHHPQDIEHTAEESHEALKPHGNAAFSVELGGRERVIIIQEVARPKKFDLEEISRGIRAAVLAEHDVVLDGVALVRGGSVPKTTSGKIQRHACRAQFLAGELSPLHAWQAPLGPEQNAVETAEYVAPRTETERLLAETWSEVLGLERCGVFDNFFDLGGHSLMATQLVSRLAPRFGVEVPLGELFDRPTIAALAEIIDSRRAAQQTADADAERELLDRLDNMSDAEARAMLGEDSSARRHADVSRYDVPVAPQRASSKPEAASSGRHNSAPSGKQIIISVGEASGTAEREAHRS
ncbi:MAG TPA: AMP-binding protein [Pirellulales bacterium]|jgi:acyl-CoA synthetase (AMP-forming)/AMP-acid ligase II/acyl carrier protein